MKKQRHKHRVRYYATVGARTLSDGFLKGLGDLVSIDEPVDIDAVSRRGATTEGLYGDMVRIGGDLRRAVDHERHDGPKEAAE